VDRPLNENLQPAQKRHQVHQVNENPAEPGRESRKVNAEYIRHSGCTAGHGQGAFIEVAKMGGGGWTLALRKVDFAA
jgi:hypothetical protein